MTRGSRHLALALSLGLAVAGWLSAHAVAYRVAEPHEESRDELLEATGHGYVEPALLGSLCVALVVVGFLGLAVSGARRGHRPPLWLFALVPPLGFALQEHAERVFHHDALHLTTVFEPTFLVGLLLQAPFAVVAFLAARFLLTAAYDLAQGLGGLPRPSLVPDATLPVPAICWIPSATAVVGGRGQRAPPATCFRLSSRAAHAARPKKEVLPSGVHRQPDEPDSSS